MWFDIKFVLVPFESQFVTFSSLHIWLAVQVGAGLECGIGVNDFMDWEVGDVVEAFNASKKQRTLEEASETVTAALAKAGL